MKQTVTESTLSIAGVLSDPVQDPAHLTMLVDVNANKGSYKPPTAVILAKYKHHFS